MSLGWKRPKVFYGWWVVGASFLIALSVGGVVVYGFTTIFEPIAKEFHWSHTQISMAASLRGLEMGLLTPLMGTLADRWGPRRLIFAGGVITTLGLILLSYTKSLGMFYGAFFVVATGLSACSGIVLMTAVANWFRRNAGIASGITVSGFGASGLLIPAMVRLIDIYRWRVTVRIFALGMLVIVLPLSLLFRHRPEQYGYSPDGEVKDAMVPDNGLASSETVDADVTVKQALRSNTFWHMTLAFTCLNMAVSAVVTHVMPYLSSIGIARSISSLVATLIPLVSVGGRLGLGWLGDKLDRRQVAAGGFAMICLGLLCFGYAATVGTWLLVPFVLFLGMGYGGGVVLRASLGREFFGKSNFGALLGFIMGINMLGVIAGPPLAGWVFDNWGSYQYIWFLFAGLAIAALISVLTTPPVNSTVGLINKT